MDELLGLGGDDYDYAAPEEGYAPPPRERLRAGVNAVPHKPPGNSVSGK